MGREVATVATVVVEAAIVEVAPRAKAQQVRERPLCMGVGVGMGAGERVRLGVDMHLGERATWKVRERGEGFRGSC